MNRQMWEERYSQSERQWSGKANRWLVELTEEIPPGRALELACGEGADAVWLAGRGWQVTAVDFADSALARGAQAAQEAGVDSAITWLAADLAEWQPQMQYDLVAVHYLHLPERQVLSDILRMAWDATAGTLLVVAHDPANLTEGNGKGPGEEALYTAEEVLAHLGLATGDPAVVLAEKRRREGDWIDGVVLLRR